MNVTRRSVLGSSSGSARMSNRLCPAAKRAIADRVAQSAERLEQQGDPLGLGRTGRARREFLRDKRAPGFEGLYEPREGRVDDPYERGAIRTVTKNIRESSTEALFARKQVGPAQYQAYERFRRLYETMSQRGGALDPAKVKVDTSGRSDPIPDSMIAASMELCQAARVLGLQGYRVVEMIGGEGMMVEEAARRWFRTDNPSRPDRAYIGRLYRDGLSMLAEMWGLSGRSISRAKMVGWRDGSPPVGGDA